MCGESYLVFCADYRGGLLPGGELPEFVATKGRTPAQVMKKTAHAMARKPSRKPHLRSLIQFWESLTAP